MNTRRLVIPAVLAVGAMAVAAGCSGSRCPDPGACYSDLTPDGDGGFIVQYHRADGGVSDVPCPPPPEGCAVA